MENNLKRNNMTAMQELVKDLQDLKKTLLYPSSFKAVDECIDLCYAKLDKEKQQSKEYAEFAVLCDRQNFPILEFDGFINLSQQDKP